MASSELRSYARLVVVVALTHESVFPRYRRWPCYKHASSRQGDVSDHLPLPPPEGEVAR